MLLEFVVDGLSAMHMLCFAVGIGTAIFIESVTTPKFLRSIERVDLDTMDAGHRLIKYALYGLWASGLGIFLVKVGLMGAPITAKLVTKFAVVAVLSVNMLLIERIVLPVLHRNRRRHLGSLTRHEIRLIGAIAGLSAAAWLMALGLGAIAVFKTLSALQLAAVFGPGLIAAPLLGAHLAEALVRRSRLHPGMAAGH